MASKLGNPNNIELLCVGMWYHCRSERGKCTSMFYSIPALKAHFKEKHPGEELKLPDNLSQEELDGKITLVEKPKLRVYIVRCRLCFLTFESQSHLNFHRKKHPKCYLERGQGHRSSERARITTYSTGRPPKPNGVDVNVPQGTSVFQGEPEVLKKRSCTSTGGEVEPTKMAQKTGKKTIERSSTKTTAPNVISTAGTSTSKKHGFPQPSKLPTKRGNAATMYKNPRKLQDRLKVFKSSKASQNSLRNIRKLGVEKPSRSKSGSKAIKPTAAGLDGLAAHYRKVHPGKKHVAVNRAVGRKFTKNSKQKQSSQVTPTARNISFENTNLAQSSNVVAAQKKRYMHTCPHCPFQGNDRQRLDWHLRLHAEGANAVVCSTCGWLVGPSALATHNNRRHPKPCESSGEIEPVVGRKIRMQKRPIPIQKEKARAEGSGKKYGAPNHVANAAKIIKDVKRAAKLVSVGDKTQKKTILKNKKEILKRENSRKKESTSGNEKRGRGRPKSATTKLPFSCPHCPFRCVPETLAETHRRLHEKGAAFVACPTCGVFLQPTKKSLASHNNRSHPKIRESSDVKEPEDSGWNSGVHYACHLCPFKGKEGTWAENHRRLHEQGAAAVVCPVCKWYVSSSSLAVHHARRHGTARISSTARGV